MQQMKTDSYSTENETCLVNKILCLRKKLIAHYVEAPDEGRLTVPKRIQFEAFIHSDLKEELDYTKIELGQKITACDESFSDDGLRWYKLSMNTLWSEQLTWWIMSWAQRIIVTQPPELAEQIHSRLFEAAANYKTIKTSLSQ